LNSWAISSAILSLEVKKRVVAVLPTDMLFTYFLFLFFVFLFFFSIFLFYWSPLLLYNRTYTLWDKKPSYLNKIVKEKR